MKTVLLITFKILEVAAYLFACWLLHFVLDWIGLFDWIDGLSNYILIPMVVILIIIVAIWFVAIFPGWIKQNKEWVNKILD